MQLHQISSTTKKDRKRIGRGGKKGTYSGRGLKGQKSRAGARIRPAYRDILKQLPKRRGFKFKPTSPRPEIINLSSISAKFQKDEIVSPATLLTKGLIPKARGMASKAKILGVGELKKRLRFKDVKISEGAKNKIEKAGGTIS